MEVLKVASRRLPAILSLLNEMDTAFPDRDKASDGEVGDRAHQQSVSNHNPDESGNTGSWSDADHIDEVHARDLDVDLRKPGWSMDRVFAIILDRCRRGVEKRVTEIIYKGYIYTKKRGWTKRKYTGPNPHDKHLHLSIAYGSGSGQSNPENITSPWGILEAVRGEEMSRKDRWSEMASREEVKEACREALSEFLWDAYNASAQNDAYKKAKPDDQKRMRNARDTFARVAADDLLGAVNKIAAGVADIQKRVPAATAPGATPAK
jgi:hypothetical protein